MLEDGDRKLFLFLKEVDFDSEIKCQSELWLVFMQDYYWFIMNKLYRKVIITF